MDSIFFRFELPSATTWFYFALILAVALFFKFSRLLSMRNLDLLSLFLPMLGLLALLEAAEERRLMARHFEMLSAVLRWPGLSALSEEVGQPRWPFITLFVVSGWLLVRCFLDLALVRRPSLAPNLNFGGLAWLAIALFLSLIAVAAKEEGREDRRDGKSPAIIKDGTQTVETLLRDVPNARVVASRSLAVACHLAVALGLIVVGWRHFQDAHAGMAAATFYLLLPYTYLFLPHTNVLAGQWHHVWPMALLVWALAAYRKPTFAGILLGLTAGSVYYPALLVPVWLSFYYRNGAARFLAAFLVGVGLCLVWLGALAWYYGDWPHNFSSVLPMGVREWLPWVPPEKETIGFWQGLHQAYRIPVFFVFAVVTVGFAFWPSPKNLAHLISLTAVLLIGTQFWYADQGGAHVLWYLPFLLLMVFRPNLSDRTAPPISPESDWLARLRGAAGRFFSWLFGLRQPSVKVS